MACMIGTLQAWRCAGSWGTEMFTALVHITHQLWQHRVPQQKLCVQPALAHSAPLVLPQVHSQLQPCSSLGLRLITWFTD